MITLIVVVAGAVVGAWLGCRWGWNAAVYWYRDRTIEAANVKAEQDRR
jgi:hypothetical protein